MPDKFNSVTALVNEGRATNVIYVDLCEEFAGYPCSLNWRDMDLTDGSFSR